jgi:hypothetical protein
MESHEHGPENRTYLLLPRIEPLPSNGSQSLHRVTRVKDTRTIPRRAVRTCGRVGSAPCVLNLGRRRKRAVGCMPQQFSPRRKIRGYPGTGGKPPQLVWEWWRKTEILPLTGIETHSVSQRSHYIGRALPTAVYCGATTNEKKHANQYIICTHMYTVSKK